MQKIAIISITLAAVLMGCGPSGNQPNVELIQDMFITPALKAQEEHEGSPNGRSMRVPPEGTVAQGYSVYKYARDPIAAGRELKNPYAGSTVTEEQLLTGKRHYEVLCMVCHGATGAGDGPIAAKMAVRPPSLLTDKVTNEWSDGRIYHVIRVGQGVMGAYGAQVGDEEGIWAVVNYVRRLQNQNR